MVTKWIHAIVNFWRHRYLVRDLRAANTQHTLFTSWPAAPAEACGKFNVLIFVHVPGANPGIPASWKPYPTSSAHCEANYNDCPNHICIFFLFYISISAKTIVFFVIFKDGD